MTIFIGLTVSQGYDLNWDDLNYHFYNGFAAIHAKVWSNIQVSMRQSYFCPWLDAIFYMLVVTLPPMAVAVVLAALQSLTYPLIFLLASATLPFFHQTRHHVLGLATAVAVLAAMAPVNILEAGGAYGDTTSAVLVIAALLAVVIGISAESGSRAWRCITAAGVLVGTATGLKLTNAPFALGLAIAIMVGAISRPGGQEGRSSFLLAATGCVAIAAAFLLVYGPWALSLMVHFQNPFFPAFNQVFKSAYAAPSSFSDPAFALPTIQDKLLFAFRRNPFSSHGDAAGLFDLRLPVAVPMAMSALLGLSLTHGRGARARPYNVPAAVTLTFFVVSYIAWLWLFAINRYVVVLDFLAPLVCLLSLAVFVSSRLWLWGGMLAISMAFLGSAYAGRELILRPFDHRSRSKDNYFGVQFTPPPGLVPGSLVALLGEQGTSFVIPYFPISTEFVRLAGSIYYVDPAYATLVHGSDAAKRGRVFGNALGKLICGRLDKQTASVFTIRPGGGPTPADFAAMKFFGLQEDPTHCTQIRSKAPFEMWMCPAQRTPDPECHKIDQ